MLKYSIALWVILFLSMPVFSQNSSRQNKHSTKESEISFPDQEKETYNKWSLNLLFSDNGFAPVATLFKQLDPNLSFLGSIFFSGAKDDRELESTDIFGNSYSPGKINRLFLVPIYLGLQYRLFREDVSDNLRPFVNGGITPAAIVYTPY